VTIALRTILPIGLTEPIGSIDIIESSMPIRPAPLNLTIVTGIIFGPVILRAKDNNNQPIDLTGWRPFAEVRKKPGSPVILDLGPVLSDATIGEITIPKWTDEQTYNLKLGDFQWSLILEDPFGDRRGPYMQGAFTITATPTKPPEGI
jgi:hypothetical protein